MTKYCLTYGSLRDGIEQGFNLREYYGLETVQNEVELKGFRLFDLGSFPGIIRSEDENDTVVFDLMEYTSEDEQQRLTSMEEGAGYVTEVQKLEIEGLGEIEANVYIFPRAEQYNEVESGNWVQYYNDKTKKSVFYV